jgi:small subunit ribosomal protein S16
VKNTDDRVTLIPSRIKYWMSVGARPSENVAVFLKKYLQKWEQKETEAATAAAAPPPAPAPATAEQPAPPATEAAPPA